MDTFTAIQTLRAFGLSFQPLNGRLIVAPRHRITDAARQLIVEHRSGILAALGEGLAADASGSPHIAPPAGVTAPVHAHVAAAAAPAGSSSLQPAIAEMGDPSAEIESYLERLAICTAEGVPEVEAHQLASAQVGAGIHILAQRQVEYWRCRLMTLPHPRDRRLDGLAAHVLAFTATPLAVRAARCGWTESELFGLDTRFGMPGYIDYLGHGVLPGSYLSTIRGPWRFAFTGDAAAISPNTITMITGSKSRLSFMRHGRYGPALWRHRQYSGPAN